ncbi:MAG: hypothetical protein WA937_01385 [Flavobacteriales bacterium]
MTNTKNESPMKTMDRERKLLARLRPLAWSLVAILLMLPAIAMQFTTEVAWTASDFLFAAVILVGSGLALEITVRTRNNAEFRIAMAVAVAAAFLLTWMNAAVGFVGSGANWANILYFLLPPTALLASFLARFSAKGMAGITVGLAIAQVAVTLFAFASGLVRPEERSAILAVNIFLVELWVVAAVLFQRAHSPQPSVKEPTSANTADVPGRKTPRTLAFVLSGLTIALALVLMALTIRKESGPGALPLLLFIIGTGWFFITLLRKHKVRG